MRKQMDLPKETIGSRIPPDWLTEIDAICKETGQTRSEWLYNLIGAELNKTDVNTVNAMGERLLLVEKKLSRLATSVVG